MHHFQAPAALLACVLSTVLAVPAPAPRPDSGLGSDPVCVDKKSYNVAEQWLYYAPPKRETGASCSSGDAGCSVATTFEHSTSISVDVGADLGLDFEEIFHAGISVSVSYTVENSESVQLTENCPIGCTCSIQSVQHMQHVEGTQTTSSQNQNGPDSDCVQNPTYAHYAADFPITNPNAAANNQLVADFSACAIGVCKPPDGGPSPPQCPPN